MFSRSHSVLNAGQWRNPTVRNPFADKESRFVCLITDNCLLYRLLFQLSRISKYFNDKKPVKTDKREPQLFSRFFGDAVSQEK